MSFRKKADFSTFTMSNMLLKRIALIVRCIQSGDLLDCPLFAIKPPLHPRSSRCSLSKYLYTKHFPKHALLDLPRSLMPRGKVHQNRGNSRHFPRGWRRQVPREMAVEPVPQQATGESAPESRVWGALSTGDSKDAHWTFSNEKRLAALGTRGRGPPQSGGRAWSFRLLNVHATRGP